MSSPIVLPEWSGNVVSALHRCRIARKELAAEIPMSESHLSAILSYQYPSALQQEKIEEALKRCIEKRGIALGRVFTPEF